MIKYHLPGPKTCQFCNARIFHQETSTMCCMNGRISLLNLPTSPELLELFRDQTTTSRHFRKFIRLYNHIFAFTSMGVHVDQNLSSTSRGIYMFRAQGGIYHQIGSLLPNTNGRPCFLQLYIYDTKHEIKNRILKSESLHEDIVERIQIILDEQNPFVHTF